MTLRENLHTPATRWPTIATLVASGTLLLLAAVTFSFIPAISVGKANGFLSWAPYLYGVTMGATVISTLVLQRRATDRKQ